MNAPIPLQHQTRLVELSDERIAARIASFVEESGGSLFQFPDWLLAVQAATGHRAIGFVAEKLGVMTGWLPFSEVRSMLFGNALISSGFGVGGGILTDDPTAEPLLAKAATQHAQCYGFGTAELRGGPIPRNWVSINDKHCGFARDLAADDEAELLAIPRKARAEVRKGLKNDLDIRVGRSDNDLANHYAVFSQSVRNLGTPVFPKSLFRKMLDAFPENSDILTVSKNGRPLASVLSFYHAGSVMPFWGGGIFEARAMRANEVMYYKLMCHARARGMERFDFGRSKTASGPFAFKKNWGFDPQPLTYARWTVPGQEVRDVDPTSDAYSRKIAVWKKLPLAIANSVGPLIARDLA